MKQTSESEIESYRIALAHLNNNDLEKAKEILIEFSNERPELAGPWANLGLIYYKQNDLPKAKTFLQKALEKNPKMAQAQNLLGLIESKNGKIQNAETLYLDAIKNKPDYALAHYNIALLYDIYLQDIKKAIQHYKTYLKLTNNKDKKTADWVEHLTNSLKKS